jgi:hypothetical protein
LASAFKADDFPENMNNQSEYSAGFRRFITRFKFAKLLAFSLSLFAVLVVSQILIGGIGHNLPHGARPLWLVATKSLYALAMLWLYAFEVRYFERRRISELAPRDIAPNATAGVVVGFTAALIISAFLFGAAHALNTGATAIGVVAIGLEAGVLLGAAYSAFALAVCLLAATLLGICSVRRGHWVRWPHRAEA